MRTVRVLNVVGARPNFVKMASLMEAYRGCNRIDPVLVHTGQHYDDALSARFFRDLRLPRPDVNLEVGSGSHAVQTAEIMKAFERVALQMRPDAVLVVGDVNSTIACGLVAAKLGVPLIHVEAGLRSGDRTMPEEINRVLTDAISDLMFCTERAGVENLAREGVAHDKVFLVGNTMVDTLLRHRERSRVSPVLDELQLENSTEAGGYAVATLHRPSNVDEEDTLAGILDALKEMQADLPVVLPLHPRLRDSLARFGLEERVAALPGLRTASPFGYLDFLKLVDNARIVLTDSGGLQEETTALGVPCVTLRENTERPVTVEVGTNRLAGTSPEGIVAAYRKATVELTKRAASARRAESAEKTTDAGSTLPPLWDGRAGDRIVATLVEKLG